MGERGRKEAHAADRNTRSGDCSALCGIPYGAKDLFAASGGHTTWGSPAFRDQTLAVDATAIRRLRQRGGVLVAKLAMTELAGGGRPARLGSSLQGQARNPWDPSRYAGGSSSGSAIVVAAGLLPYALGSETSGSILGPAAFSGVTGYRPTYGLIPRGGTMTLSWSLDKVGLLARSAADCATVMQALCNADGHRGRSTPDGRRAPLQHLPAGETNFILKTIRIAFAALGIEEAAPSTRPALVAGLSEFRSIVPHLVDLGLPRTIPYDRALETIMTTEAAIGFREELLQGSFHGMDARQLSTLQGGLHVTAGDYFAALEIRESVRTAFAELFERVGAILAVSRTTVAPRLDEPASSPSSTSIADMLTSAANLAGLPGVGFPCGLSAEGLPVGLQLVGPRGSDLLLLRLVSAYQRVTEHHKRHPADTRKDER